MALLLRNPFQMLLEQWPQKERVGYDNLSPTGRKRGKCHVILVATDLFLLASDWLILIYIRCFRFIDLEANAEFALAKMKIQV